MKRFAYVFCKIALVPLLIAGVGVGLVWRGNRQRENEKDLFFGVNNSAGMTAFNALARGADPNARDMPDDTRTLKERFLDFIHHTGPRKEKYDTPLHRAVLVYPENSTIIAALLQAGADPNASRTEADTVPPHFDTPFLTAEIVGRYENGHLLLQHHADINARNGRGDTALFWVSSFNFDAEVEYLLRHGADTEAEGPNGDTALIRAASLNGIATVRSLIKHGANVNHRNIQGYTALYYAHSVGYPTIERLLLKAGAVE